MSKRSFGLALVLAAAAAMAAPARAQSAADAIDGIVTSAAGGRDFSGTVLVTRGGDIVFDKAYGEADVENHVANTPSTSFHIAELSRAYTAAIVMHLAEKGTLSLDNTVVQFLPDVPNGASVTIRDLLEATARAPDAASDYEILARIVEQRTGTSLGESLNAFLFAPRWMDGAGIDADDLAPDRRYARGYSVDASGALKPADPVHWSELAGDASVFTTTRDELRFVDALFDGDLVTPETRAAMFDARKPGFAYGWVKREDGEAYEAEGERGGFSAFVMRVPAADATVIVLGNVESPAAEKTGRAVAALVLAKP